MENLEEILKVVFGLVFGALYLFGGQIFKGRKEDKPQRPTTPRQKNEDDRASDEHEVRQREIREAIRRKIEERRRRETGAEPPVQEPVIQYQEQLSDDSGSQEQMDTATALTVPLQETVEADEQFSWDVSDNVYDRQMQERLQQIEATKRRAEALKQQIGQIGLASTEGNHSKDSIPEDLLSGSVRSTLRNPRAARAAFIYGEILGKPLSLRRLGISLAD